MASFLKITGITAASFLAASVAVTVIAVANTAQHAETATNAKLYGSTPNNFTKVTKDQLSGLAVVLFEVNGQRCSGAISSTNPREGFISDFAGKQIVKCTPIQPN